MIGAIAGDVIGSVFEHYAKKSTQFPLFSRHSKFTDDTVLTLVIIWIEGFTISGRIILLMYRVRALFRNRL